MNRDAYDLNTSSGSSEAFKAFEQSVFGLAAHRPSTSMATLAADPDHVADVPKGFAKLIPARSELAINADVALTDACDALTRNGNGTADGRILVDASAAANQCYFSGAIEIVDKVFADRPATFLPFKISHSLRFMSGDRTGMLASSGQAVDALDVTAPAAGFVLGCHAFTREEAGPHEVTLTYSRRLRKVLSAEQVRFRPRASAMSCPLELIGYGDPVLQTRA
ncbi:hypothetical protein GFL54_31385 [Rhizobium laguerreae]|uniref:Uncharacterized protein n=1 Tax=Rhizobium laguerreae TaxID=1076926 RepID=A0ABR6GKG8_9HYPH|nr:hypothetical protein [Rhizobium laguerreae]MBB3166336.1 hypothetical protein [Rhizobium laguerreae]NKM88668.1 hypothetical protein [Rhizobium laguerreae]OOO42816.1 hypothetical protein BS630_29965 [Rhizobium laguerreae]